MSEDSTDPMSFVRRPAEPVWEVEMQLSPWVTPGMLLEINGQMRMVVGIVHRHDGSEGTTRVKLITPNWRWRLRYRVAQFFRRVWTFIKKLARRHDG